MDNVFIDADGVQSRGAKRVNDAQGAQLVGGNGSMVSGSTAGAGLQLSAAEDVEEEVVGNVCASKKKKKRGKKSGQQQRLSGYQKQDFQRQRDEANQ